LLQRLAQQGFAICAFHTDARPGFAANGYEMTSMGNGFPKMTTYKKEEVKRIFYGDAQIVFFDSSGASLPTRHL
jgi:hypothetical protein